MYYCVLYDEGTDAALLISDRTEGCAGYCCGSMSIRLDKDWHGPRMTPYESSPSIKAFRTVPTLVLRGNLFNDIDTILVIGLGIPNIRNSLILKLIGA